MIDGPRARFPMHRFFWLPLAVSAVLALAVLAGLIAMSWRSLDRLRPVQTHLAHIARIQDVGLKMEETLLKGLRGAHVDPAELVTLQHATKRIAALEGAMDPHTAERLDRIAQRIAQPDANAVGILFEALAELRAVLAAERAQHDGLLEDVINSTRMEFRMALFLLVALPLIGGAGLILLRRRVERPLQDLQHLMARLSGSDFRPVPERVLKASSRQALPAFNSYNALVSRLQQLEAEHEDRERTLERRVREATEALLAQSRELARAERLAAVGVVSAGVAHDLRNPLAGIQLACTKLQRALADTDQAPRIAAVISELKRIDHLLTAQVDGARHEPEVMVRVNIATLVDDLLALVRFQIPATVTLESHVDAAIECMLPAAGLRQALLNLLLNAIQSLGGDGRVTVSAEHSNGKVIITVGDDGAGFPEEMLRVAFRPFATSRVDGTGLGLPMARRFALDLDGDLHIENCSPHGAQVSLHLPCRAAGSPEGRRYG